MSGSFKGNKGTAADRAPTLTTARRPAGTDGKYRTVTVIHCDDCSATAESAFGPDAPEDFIANKFRGLGWTVDSRCKSAACPTCSKEPRVTDISPAALRKQRQMYALLDDHFAVEPGRYSDGWSDARIAKECGLSDALVTRTREAAYGPIKEDPELAKLRAELDNARRTFEHNAKSLRDMVDEILNPTLAKISEIEGRIEAMTRRAAA